jgi:hypothetical protein
MTTSTSDQFSRVVPVHLGASVRPHQSLTFRWAAAQRPEAPAEERVGDCTAGERHEDPIAS